MGIIDFGESHGILPDAHEQGTANYQQPVATLISLQLQISLKTCCSAAASQGMASSCESEMKPKNNR